MIPNGNFTKSNDQVNTNPKLQVQLSEISTSSTRDSSEEQDPWHIAPGADEDTPWSELTRSRKFLRIAWISGRLAGVFILLYCFVCSLDVLQEAFQLAGGRKAGQIFTSSVLISNPVSGLMIGVLVTVLVQSSSTSTSIVVSMVGAGLIEVKPSIPIIMGANIGTTVTNTIVSLTQSADRQKFRRAFAGATVHDAFNWLTVMILLPIEVATGYLYYLTNALIQSIHSGGDSENPQFLKVITTPLTKKIVEIDKKVIDAIAQQTDRQKFPLAKYYCKAVSKHFVENITNYNDTRIEEIKSKMFTYNIEIDNETSSNSSIEQIRLSWSEVIDQNSTKCDHLLVGVGLEGYLNESVTGAILLVLSLISLVLCLLFMVKILNSLLRGTMASMVRKSINADFPGKLAFLTGYAAMAIGAVVTVLVQSSSVFTSALTPLVGLGIVTVERVYPLTLGSNIGTTITSILAALTADPEAIRNTLQISLCHLFFNISGIILFYPIPFMRMIPILIAKQLGTITSKYRWFAGFYLILMFILLPVFVFGLSLAGPGVLIGILVPILIIFILIVVINVMQRKRHEWLPTMLQNWKFLPLFLHSLKPYDRIISACLCCGQHMTICGKTFHCCQRCSQQNADESTVHISNDDLLNSKLFETGINCKVRDGYENKAATDENEQIICVHL